jgi:predicted transcriptional regulator
MKRRESEEPWDRLSRRERELMEVVYRRGEATVEEVRRGLSDPPSYSSVRTILRILEEKGRLRHRKEGARYVYHPVVPAREARRSALRGIVDTFFSGAPDEAFATLLDLSEGDLTEEELDRLSEMIEKVREEGR